MERPKREKVLMEKQQRLKIVTWDNQRRLALAR